VHAVAYIFRTAPLVSTVQTINLGYSWFHTIAEAKAFIEGNIRAYFGIKAAFADMPPVLARP
jgi:hypothetical protein